MDLHLQMVRFREQFSIRSQPKKPPSSPLESTEHERPTEPIRGAARGSLRERRDPRAIETRVRNRLLLCCGLSAPHGAVTTDQVRRVPDDHPDVGPGATGIFDLRPGSQDR